MGHPLFHWYTITNSIEILMINIDNILFHLKSADSMMIFSSMNKGE